jgi:hypothetical protein
MPIMLHFVEPAIVARGLADEMASWNATAVGNGAIGAVAPCRRAWRWVETIQRADDRT